jgi:PPOX class probable F420-dependent enzyme
MPVKLTEDMMRMLDAPNFAALSTLMEDGWPKVDPTWVGREGDSVLIATDRKSIKAVNMERDPRVALAITDYRNPYEQLLIRGRVVEARDDNNMLGLDALSQVYLGKPFPRRKWSSRVLYVIEPLIARYYAAPLQHVAANS